MLHWMSLALSLLLISSVEASSPNVVEETLYQNFLENIQTGSDQKTLNGFTSFEQSLYVDALWDLVEDKNPEALGLLNQLNTFHYDLVQRLRLGILKIKYGQASILPSELNNELMNALQTSHVDRKIVYLLAAYEEELLKSGHEKLINLAKTHTQYFDISQDEDALKDITDDVVSDLFYNSPDVASYMNGEYVQSVKIFMFCRENRLYPCLMVMRDVHGEVVRNENGELWHHRALASSARGLPSYVRNGNTPAGIFTIDSVMPYADQQMSFGKFRRMIINFIPKSKNEKLIKSLLPASSHDLEWWIPTVVSRDVGRNLFRIHGTGKINTDPDTPYYPFMRTSGCIAQRENTYNGVTFKDQRELLDSIMVAMGLAATYENETKVKGILYLMEIDDQNAPVTLEDLALRGIE